MSELLRHLALHSVGLGVIALLLAACLATRRLDAVASYRLTLGALLGCLILPIGQWAAQGRAPSWGASLRARWVVEGVHEEAGHEEAVAHEHPEVLVPARTGPKVEGDEARAAARANPTNTPSSPAPSTGRPVDSPDLPSATPALASPTGVEPPRSPRPPSLLAIAVGLYGLGVGVVAARQALRWRLTMRLLRRCEPLEEPSVLAAWHALAAADRRLRRVRLLVSDELLSPACWGWRRPVLVIPAASLEPKASPEVLRWALRHESVHLRRGDPVVAWLQSLVTALYWFHPAAWWLSAQAHRWRELSCDQLVVRHGGGRRSYALALLESAHRRAKPQGSDFRPRGRVELDMDPAGSQLLHWSRSRSELRRRIEMLVRRPPSPRRGTWPTTLATALLATTSLAQVSFAAALFPAPVLAATLQEDDPGGAGPQEIRPPKAPPSAASPAESTVGRGRRDGDELERLRAQVTELGERLAAAERELENARTMREIDRRLSLLEARLEAPTNPAPPLAPDADRRILRRLLSRHLAPRQIDELLAEYDAVARPAPLREAEGGNEPNELLQARDARPEPPLSRKASALVDALASKDAAIRWKSVDGLDQHRDEDILPALLPLLADPDPFVQFRTIGVVRAMGAVEAIPSLIEQLDDGDALVRDEAHATLQEITGVTIDGSVTELSGAQQLKERWADWWQELRR